MPEARFTAHQLITVMTSVESGGTVNDASCEVGFSEGTYDNGKSQYAGRKAAAIKQLKDPEEGNRRRKQLFVDLSPESRVLKELL